MAQTWSESRLRDIINAGETQFVDFKQQWYDLGKKEDKAELARDVLALANTASEDHSGLLLIGVHDSGTVLGAGSAPPEEAIAQILSHYLMPPPAFSVARVMVSGLPVDLLQVPFSPYRPHYANREGKGLETGTAYVRRGTTTGRLSVPEIAAMARAPHFTVKADPLELGFVEYINWSSGVMMARLVNLTEEPMSGIHLMMEISSRLKPQSFRRQVLRTDGTLKPRESQEIMLEINNVLTMSAERGTLDPRMKVDDRWLDVTLYVTYRDRSGYLKSKSEILHLSG